MLPELRARIEAAARDSGRSMNAEVVYRLQRSFEHDAQALAASVTNDLSDPSKRSPLEAQLLVLRETVDGLLRDRAQLSPNAQQMLFKAEAEVPRLIRKPVVDDPTVMAPAPPKRGARPKK
jgi:hypothetical protein